MATAFTKLYFAYGSNMSLRQMERRCPNSPYRGRAILHGWKWFVNQRGYANVMASGDDVAHGLVFLLTPDDEASLDKTEGVPESYQRQWLSIELEGGRGQTVKCLVYVDGNNTTSSVPRDEYITRMNNAIADAEDKGIPTTYIQKYLRPFIPYRGKFRIENVKYGPLAVGNNNQPNAVVATGNVWKLNKIDASQYHIQLASSTSSAIEANSLLVVTQNVSETWAICGVGTGYLITKANSTKAWKLENSDPGIQVKISSLTEDVLQRLGSSEDLPDNAFNVIGDEWRWKITFIGE